MISNKKILFLSPFNHWPLLHGTIVRSHFLAKYLALSNQLWYVHRKGEDLFPQNATYILIPTTSRKIDQIFNLSTLLYLTSLMRKNTIDIILVSHIWSGVYGILLKAITGKKLIFDNHNVEILRFRSTGNLLWPLIGIFEWIICHISDMILCVSPHDKEQVNKIYNIQRQKIQVVPNGADIQKLKAYPFNKEKIRSEFQLSPNEKLILFFGTLEYVPNQKAVKNIVEQLLPRLIKLAYQAKFIIVGSGGLEYQKNNLHYHPDIIFTGFVDDIYAMIKSADIVVVPLTSGSGTRLKIIESVACGTPVVSTSIGAEGLDKELMSEYLHIYDAWDEFTHCIIQASSKRPTVNLPPGFVISYDWKEIVESIYLV